MPETTTAPAHAFISHLSTTPHVKAMVKALRKAGCFTIDENKDAETVEAKYGKTAKVVFWAICKGGDVWIVRRHPQLFD